MSRRKLTDRIEVDTETKTLILTEWPMTVEDYSALKDLWMEDEELYVLPFPIDLTEG